jgi:hypothetical protein
MLMKSFVHILALRCSEFSCLADDHRTRDSQFEFKKYDLNQIISEKLMIKSCFVFQARSEYVEKKNAAVVIASFTRGWQVNACLIRGSWFVIHASGTLNFV